MSDPVSPSVLRRAAARQSGFTLIELMIAITLGILILLALTTTFINNSAARDEIQRANQRIENGRYAIQVLADELRLAGYLAEFNPATAGFVPLSAKPDPCSTTLSSTSPPGIKEALQLHIQGYDKPDAAARALLTCLGTDIKAGTDIIVVRRAATSTSACGAVPNAPCFQASLCSTERVNPLLSFNVDNVDANLTLKARNCSTKVPTRQYHTRIYFIADNDNTPDGIPTLKRAELTGGSGSAVAFTVVPIAEGIENLQLEYGIDNDNDGVADVVDADPDTYNPSGARPCAGTVCVDNWRNVMSVRINLLARNLTASQGYTDTKTYKLGLNADGSANNVAGTGAYKRHVFQTDVRLNNPAGRR
jgi:type IV pilus assembly protein PilW